MDRMSDQDRLRAALIGLSDEQNKKVLAFIRELKMMRNTASGPERPSIVQPLARR